MNVQKQIEGCGASEEHNCQELGSEYGEENVPTRVEEKGFMAVNNNPVELAFYGDLVLGNKVVLVAVQQQKKLCGLRTLGFLMCTASE